ncbi:MAG: TonB-dependent receptor [Terriglobia bacterium]|nr:MAG: TonB-dependent receptor [Terriglobia bacterium]
MFDLRALKRAAMSLALAGLASAIPTLQAQTLKATVLGTITDSSKAVVSGVNISITEVNTNFQRTEITNEEGFYVFANLDPGNYRLEAQHPGFRKVVRTDIGLIPNTTARIDLELTPGAVSEVVDVTAEAPLLQTDRSDTGSRIETQQLNTIPLLNNRNYQNLLLVVPGVQRAYRSNSAFFNSQEHLQSVVNGLDQRNNYMIEGVDNNVENLTGIVPPADAIASVEISTTNYDPELGRAGGAVTNVTLKSGTNGFHGSTFAYHRDNDLQAKNVFASTTPHSVYNQFGGSFGGRILRDKLFFFGDYQGSREVFGNTNLPTIPTAAFRQGDLSASSTTIYDPATGNQDGTGRIPFDGNQIPISRISPIASKILNFIPAPTRSGLAANFEKPTSQSKSIDQFDVKIDYVASAKDRLFVRYSYQRATVFDPGLYGPNGGIYGGPHNSGFQGSGPSRNQSPGLNYSHIFSPTLVTEVRFGIVRNRNEAINIDHGLTTSRDIGIPNVNLDDWSSGLTEIRIDGYDNPVVGFVNSLPWKRSVTNFNYVNNWTKTKSTHLIKWGFDIRRERQDLLQTQVFNPRGRFQFTAGPTARNGDPRTSFGNSFAAFLLDQPNQIGRDLAIIFPARRNTIYNLYFQDKWQISKKLTVDLGMRWEYWPSSTPHYPGGFSNYNPFNNTLELAGLGSVPNDLGIESQKKSFGPRLGAAYRLDEKTVLRGGYGISYLLRTTNVYNFPVSQANQFNPANSFVAAGSMAAGAPTPNPVLLPSTGVIVTPPDQSYVYMPKDRPQGYVQSWNVALQRALPSNFAVELAFVGNHGVNIPTSNNININAGLVPGLGAAGRPENILFGRKSDTNEPYAAHSYYDALQAKLNRRFSNGFMLTTSYAFGKSIDFNGSTTGGNFNNINFAANRGLADWDRRHIFTQSYVYELPFGRGKYWAHTRLLAALFGGWQINALWTWESGLPLDVAINNASLNAPGNINRPNVTGPVQIFGNIGPGQRYFDTAAFSAPLPNTFGNAGRNVLHGPRLFEIDSSVFRKIRLTEQWSLEFRAEAFNATNTPHFDRPDSNYSDAAFGQVTTARGNQSVQVNENRQLQFSLRLMF